MSEFSVTMPNYEDIFKSIFQYDQLEFSTNQSIEDMMKNEQDTTIRMKENLTKISLRKRALKKHFRKI